VSTLTTDRESRFRTLYADVYGDVLRFSKRRVHPSHAEDVVADTFLVVWRRLDDAPRRPGDLRAWLYGIARNCILNTRRDQDRRDALAVRIAEAVPAERLAAGVDSDFIAQRLDLAAAWRGLSDTDQEVLALTVFEDLTSPQAARVLGTTANAYRLRLLRARRALRHQLELTDSSVYAELEARP
jgi:RNA polymerase sigma-70 factor (ECF subfamily)